MIIMLQKIFLPEFVQMALGFFLTFCASKCLSDINDSLPGQGILKGEVSLYH
jgi:hypothetical protein